MIWTYFIQESISKRVKVGRTNDVEKRLKLLQTGNSQKLVLIALFRGDIEVTIHKAFSKYRIRGEWFCFTGRFKRFCKAVIKRKDCHGLMQSWKMRDDELRRQRVARLQEIAGTTESRRELAVETYHRTIAVIACARKLSNLKLERVESLFYLYNDQESLDKAIDEAIAEYDLMKRYQKQLSELKATFGITDFSGAHF